jgi:hypothetical protein
VEGNGLEDNGGGFLLLLLLLLSVDREEGCPDIINFITCG